MSLEEVFFPSIVVCNMNTLRRSFVLSLLQDSKLNERNFTFNELKKVVHLTFIDGNDYKMSERDQMIVEGQYIKYIIFPLLLQISF